MKITALRFVDYWIGRPVCELLTIFDRFVNILSKKPKIENPRSFLFIKLFGLGSIILSYPTIKEVRKRYPDAKIYFLTFKQNKAILSLVNVVDDTNIITVSMDSIFSFLSDIIKIFIFLRRQKFDVLIDMEFFSRATAILGYLIGAKNRIGFYGYHTEGLKRGRLINTPVNYNHTLHVSRVFFTLLKPFGITQDSFSPELPHVRPNADYNNKISVLLKDNGIANPEELTRWITINPNASDLAPLRKWPKEYFIDLSRKILESHDDTGIIYIGSKSEQAFVDSLLSSIGFEGRVCSIASKTSLRDLIDVFHFADIFITNDSGPAHIASLTPIKGIVLFGPETSAQYSPLSENLHCIERGLDCQPCITVFNGKRSFCKENLCLRQITPEDIFKCFQSMISSSGDG
jgi:ADP-heptose:LPS heptosyltransferase